MAETQQTERVVPDDLVMGFTNLSRVVWGFGIAVVLHLVIFGVTSVDTIHGMIDPGWAEAQAAAQEEKVPEAAAESDVGETLEDQMATVPEDEPGDGAAEGEGEATGEEGETETATGDELPEDIRDTPVGQRITETASPEEIPDKPDDLGISVDETNPF